MSDTTPRTLSSWPETPPTQAGPEPSSKGAESTILKIQHAISMTRDYITTIVKQVIKTFLEIYHTNTRLVVIIVATLVLLTIFVVTIFILLASALVLWWIPPISAGIIFVVVGGLISLALKLIIFLHATIPLAGTATGLLVGANATLKFIIDKLLKGNHENVATTLKEIDWKVFIDGTAAFGSYAAQGIKTVIPALGAICDVLSTLSVVAHSVLRSAIISLNNQQNSPVDESNPRAREPVLREVEVVEVKEEAGELINNQEASSGNLKHRAPFPEVADDVESQK